MTVLYHHQLPHKSSFLLTEAGEQEGQRGCIINAAENTENVHNHKMFYNYGVEGNLENGISAKGCILNVTQPCVDYREPIR